MKRDTIYTAILALCITVNVYATAKRFWPLSSASEPAKTYSYVGDDYPEHLPVETRKKSITTVFDQSANFPISGPGAAELWHTVYPAGYGFVRMGSNDRLLCTAMFHELHCLEKMRILLDDPSNKEVSFPHQQHCMNYLRQLFLCKADVTLEPISGLVHGMELDATHDLSMMSGNGVTYACGDSQILYSTVAANYVDWKGRWNVTKPM